MYLIYHTLEYYAEINTTGNKLGTGILCILRLEPLWEIIQCGFTSKGYKGFGPADLRILYDENILRGGKTMRNLTYFLIRQSHRIYVPLEQ